MSFFGIFRQRPHVFDDSEIAATRRAFLFGGAAAIAAAALPVLPAIINTQPYFNSILYYYSRRIWPQIIAYEICGVQPLTEPVGEIFKSNKQLAWGWYLNQLASQVVDFHG